MPESEVFKSMLSRATMSATSISVAMPFNTTEPLSACASTALAVKSIAFAGVGGVDIVPMSPSLASRYSFPVASIDFVKSTSTF